MQTINLDISAKTIIPLLHAKQADVGRKFKVILSDGGAAYPLPAGAAVSVWYSGASGEGNYTDVGANSAVSVSENEIVVEMIAQMLANYGAGTVCIVIHTAGGDQLGTWNIPYMVESLPGMGSAAAQAYFTAFSKAVESLPYPDASLSTPGKAADAAATGVALAGKAPAGYGLGGACRSIDNWDNATECGFWSSWEGLPEIANITGYTHQGIVYQYNGIVYQDIRRVGGSETYRLTRKRMSDGTWSEWEFDNPPMVPGVEYRTTERWNGKPVYTKLINFGAMPNNSSAYANNALPATMRNAVLTGYMESVTGNVYEYSSFLSRCKLWATVSGNNGYIGINTSQDYSGYTAYIVAKYTKSTD